MLTAITSWRGNPDEVRSARVYSQCSVRESRPKPVLAMASILRPRLAAADRSSPTGRRCIPAFGSRIRREHPLPEHLRRFAAEANPTRSERDSYAPKTCIPYVHFSTGGSDTPKAKGSRPALYYRGRGATVADRPFHRRIRDTWTALKRWVQRAEPEAPEDPYAYVGAPTKPRTPRRSAAAKAEP